MQHWSKTINTKQNKLQAKKLSQFDEKTVKKGLSICTNLSKTFFKVKKTFTDQRA